MKNLKIQVRLSLGFAFLVLLSLAVAALAYFGIRDLRDNKLETIEHNLLTGNLLLEMRTHEKDYFLRDLFDETYFETGESAYLDAFTESYNDLKSNLETLKSMVNSEFVDSIDSIEVLLDNYYNAFFEVVDLSLEKGYGKLGLVGALKDATYSVADYSDDLNDGDLSILLLNTRAAEKDYLNSKDPAYVAEWNSLITEMKTHIEEAEFGEVVQAAFLRHLKKYESSFQAIVDIDQNIGLTETDGLIGQYRTYVDEIKPKLEAQLESVNESIEADIAQIVYQLSILMGIGLIIAFVLSILISNSVSKPIKVLVEKAERIADGDFTEEIVVNRKDEIGVLTSSFKKMQEELSVLIHGINTASVHVKDSTFQLASASEQSGTSAMEAAEEAEKLSMNANEQLSLMKATDETIKELIDEINDARNYSNNVNDKADEVRKSSADGQNSIHSAVTQMTAIKETASKTEETINALKEKSVMIGNITDVINGISEQTNLLALNAAIEAARAGEHGRGFSVVAEEVRKLAEDSKESTEKISNLIKDIQDQIDLAIKSTTDNIDEVNHGTGVIHSTGKLFNLITQEVDEVTELVKSLNTTMHSLEDSGNEVLHQVENVVEIVSEASDSTHTMSATAQEQSAMAEEISSQANHVSGLADELIENISRFKV